MGSIHYKELLYDVFIKYYQDLNSNKNLMTIPEACTSMVAR